VGFVKLMFIDTAITAKPAIGVLRNLTITVNMSIIVLAKKIMFTFLELLSA
jgi:hypothetical protein